MKKRIISLVLVVATLFAMSSIAFTANAISNNVIVADGGGGSTIRYICGADNVGVGFRLGPSSNNKQVYGGYTYGLHNNILVRINFVQSSGWANVTTVADQKTGWVYNSFLIKDFAKPNGAISVKSYMHIIGADSAGVGFRTGPSSNFHKIKGLSNYTRVYVYYRLSSGLACVQYTYYNGNKFVSIIGYVYAKYLRS